MYTPELRFPEFVGHWENKKLGELTSWASGGTPPKDNIDYWNGDIPWISASSMRGTKYADSELKITDEGLKKGSKLAKAGTLLILVRGSMLFNRIPIGIATKDVAFNQDVKSIVVTEAVGAHYILQWFTFYESRLMSMVTGTGIGAGKLDLDELKGVECCFPALPEQTKIAKFLTAVDEKIQALKKKKGLLEQYKKGVMQKLFSQELRFTDENGKEKFSEYIKLYRGSSPRPINLFTTKNPAGVNWIKIGDTKGCDNYLIENVEEKITIDGAKKSREVYKGELILANSMSFGKSYLLKIDGCIYDGWFVLREFQEYYGRGFLHQLLNSDFLQKQYKTLSTGGVVQNISSEIVYSTMLFKPSIPEQTLIANFLTALDLKVNHTNTQLEQTELWKKGLLQKMFC